MYIDPSTNKFIKQGALLAPNSYWNNSKSSLNLITNSCGTTSIIGALVPDSLLGTDITEVCNIHDYMYGLGHKREDRKIADQIFLNNMIEAIEEDQSFFVVKVLRKFKAYLYYLGVRVFGDSTFNYSALLTNQTQEN